MTGATSMYNGGVPEREIQETIGHRSIEALRKYECTSVSQHQAVSNMLSSSVPVSYATGGTAVGQSGVYGQAVCIITSCDVYPWYDLAKLVSC